MLRRWLFADQLGQHFLDDPTQPAVMIESKAVFRRRVYHRQKAHLVLSALRHRAAELGDQVVYLRTETYRDGLRQVSGPLEVCHPTSRRARALVHGLPDVAVLPPRGFITGLDDFAGWADQRRGALRMDDFYRFARLRHGVLVVGDEPEGGRWSFDADSREPPPGDADRLDVPPPPGISEDEIDAEVRHDLDRWEREGIRFVGRDGPRLFPATRAEATARLTHFVRHRLTPFGPYEDAMLAADPFMAHSMLSSSFNLGLLDPMAAVRAAERAYRTGAAPLASVEGFVRQLLGWRDFVWNLYWYFDAGYRDSDRLLAMRTVPRWWEELDADSVRARCLSDVLAGVRDRGWVHHVPRLMVLGNYALQRGWRPAELVDWFHRSFVDGFEWVMTVNVVGMSQFADLGAMSTKPYASGGAYLNRMSDYCGGCRYDPRRRVGEKACPFTAGYWYFLDRTRGTLPPNARMARSLAQLDRLTDLAQVKAQEKQRGDRAP
ncbi:cryptochrome/photolyase family protein [Plantactinospora sp. GCM10030261]|uniref:cryptochrome/photolyase family protein n=1 Tax=Plantactinospora sp. GCM10030261 TaxID=3273420 RepID=UPI0036192AF2